jgi:glutathione synthase/RimK-type ligase-like ATP-grasp enzyme
MSRAGETRSTGGAAPRVPLNVLFGLPNDQKAWIIVEGDGRPLNYDLPGTLGVLPYLSKERFSTSVIYVEPGRTRPLKLGPGPLLNHVAEPDACSESLMVIAQIVAQSQRPCLNHPSAVAGTTRDAVSRVLAGIAGLKVPATIRLRERKPEDIREAIRQAGLSYPILLRIAGTHLGMSLMRVDRPDELDAVRRLNREDHSSLYATEFCEFASEDGLYRKYRIAVVGDEIFLRHVYVADSWLVHRERQIANPEQEGGAILASFERDLRPRLRPMFREIARRLGLDFFGVDCNIDAQGQVLLFEANACMKILGYSGPDQGVWKAPIATITAAFEKHLAQPTTWRHFSHA